MLAATPSRHPVYLDHAVARRDVGHKQIAKGLRSHLGKARLKHQHRTERDTLAAQRSQLIDARERPHTPPPTSTESPSTAQISLIAARLAAQASSSSSSAAERSTTCTHVAPLLDKGPRLRRLDRRSRSSYVRGRPVPGGPPYPAMRSIAGNTIMRPPPCNDASHPRSS